MLRTDKMSDAEIRAELTARGLDEHLSDLDLARILEDEGYVKTRVNDFTNNRTEEARIATAIDAVEII